MASNLPPGVTQAMIDHAYGLDLPEPMSPAWPRCMCGAILTLEPGPVPEGAPLYEPCPLHGADHARCDGLAEEWVELMYREDEDYSDEKHRELMMCGGPMYASYQYRVCKKCGAVNVEAVL